MVLRDLNSKERIFFYDFVIYNDDSMDVTMIPQYMEFNLFGWINTLKPLIVPAWFGSAYYVFLMRQFLMGIPRDF